MGLSQSPLASASQTKEFIVPSTTKPLLAGPRSYVDILAHYWDQPWSLLYANGICFYHSNLQIGPGLLFSMLGNTVRDIGSMYVTLTSIDQTKWHLKHSTYSQFINEITTTYNNISFIPEDEQSFSFGIPLTLSLLQPTSPLNVWFLQYQAGQQHMLPNILSEEHCNCGTITKLLISCTSG